MITRTVTIDGCEVAVTAEWKNPPTVRKKISRHAFLYVEAKYGSLSSSGFMSLPILAQNHTPESLKADVDTFIQQKAEEVTRMASFEELKSSIK